MMPFTLMDVRQLFESFFFTEVSTVPLALLRVLLMSVVLTDLIMLWPDRYIWFGERGPINHARWREIVGRTRFSMFAFTGSSDRAVTLVFVVHACLAVCALLGVATAVTLPLLFVTLVSIHHRNIHILYGGDCVTRLLVFLLCLAPCGESLSLDRWLAASDLGLSEVSAAWPLRLIQLQMSVIYLYSYLHKDRFDAWQRGTAVWYVVRNAAFKQLPLPGLVGKMWVSRLLTWATLLLELALGTVVWIEELTVPLVVLAVVFHLVLAYTLSIHLFSWVMIAGLTSFIPPSLYLDEAALGPTSAAQLATPESWEVAVIAAYLIFMLCWDMPIRTLFKTGFAKVASAPIMWAGLHHSWSMFSGNPPAKVWGEIEVVVERASGASEIHYWDQVGGFSTTKKPRSGRRRSHRLRKLSEAVSKPNTALHRAFIDYASEQLDRADDPLVAIALVKVFHTTAGPDEPSEVEEPFREPVSSRAFFSRRKIDMSELEETLAHSAFAWKLLRGRAVAEAAEIALLVGITSRRLGLSDAPALGRIKELIGRRVRLDPRACDSFARLVRQHLSGEALEVYLALLSDLREGYYREAAKQPALRKVASIGLGEPWIVAAPVPMGGIRS